MLIRLDAIFQGSDLSTELSGGLGNGSGDKVTNDTMICWGLLINNHGGCGGSSGVEMRCGETLNFTVQGGFGVCLEEGGPGSGKDTVELTSQSRKGSAASGRDRAGTDTSYRRWYGRSESVSKECEAKDGIIRV